MDILDGPFVLESETDIIHDPMEPMDPLDPPPCDPLTKNRKLWLCGTLQDDERWASIQRSFRESVGLGRPDPALELVAPTKKTLHY